MKVTSHIIELATAALEDVKALDINVLDVKDLTSITDAMIICSGTSKRHLKALADNVVKTCKQANIQPLGLEGAEVGEWILVDLGDVIVHVMTPHMREFYHLEALWSPAPNTDQQVEG